MASRTDWACQKNNTTDNQVYNLSAHLCSGMLRKMTCLTMEISFLQRKIVGTYVRNITNYYM